MTKCPKCGYKPPKPKLGRPKKLDDAYIKRMTKEGWSLGAIATSLGVTRGAIQASLKRVK